MGKVWDVSATLMRFAELPMSVLTDISDAARTIGTILRPVHR
jgi:hypothetical protein